MVYVYTSVCENELWFNRTNAKANVKKKNTAKAQAKAKIKVCIPVVLCRSKLYGAKIINSC